jgi:UDPglucose--hexose-1-phosphate uridylyltransferase
MPELRKDPVIGRWVIIASQRAKRPVDQVEPVRQTRGGFCPFCAGNEDKTPPEILSYRSSGSTNEEGWWVRVVPNKFPALQVEGNLDRTGDGMYDRMNGIGVHEVIIETPDHVANFSNYSEKHVEEILWAYRERINDLKQDSRLQYILVFKNHGRRAGASLDHSHSQLIATPIVPKRVQEEITGSLKYYRYKERCVFCDMVHQEIRDNKRVLMENHNHIAFCPYASRFPFETWILPKRHSSHFEDISKPELVDLAKCLKRVLKKLNDVLDSPPYNFILHSSPCQGERLPHYHWHFEIIPKLTSVAGFEWGTGFYINSTAPEKAATLLAGHLGPEDLPTEKIRIATSGGGV